MPMLFLFVGVGSIVAGRLLALAYRGRSLVVLHREVAFVGRD
jgi:hypothetical protein